MINVNFAKSPSNKLIYNNWMRQIGAVTTVSCINSYVKFSKYFARRDKRRDIKSCGIKNCRCLNSLKPKVPQILASDRIMIIVFVPISFYAKVPLDYYTKLSIPQSAPKILFVLITNNKLRTKNYSWMNFAFERGYVNFDLLEVSPKTKIGKRVLNFDHRIVQLDTLANKVTIKPHNRKITWFKDKVKNYQKRKIMVDPKRAKSNFYEEIIRSKVKYTCFSKKPLAWYLLRIFKFKNFLFTQRDDHVEYWLPKKFIIKNNCGFRISSLSEQVYASVIVLRNRDAMLHRASDLFWRYFEANLALKKNIISSGKSFPLKHIHSDCYKLEFEIFVDEDFGVRSEMLLTIIAIGCFGSIIGLSVEILINR